MKSNFNLAQLMAANPLKIPQAYVNSNANSKLFICATPQNADLDQTGYEALTWVEIKGIGSHGEVGTATNILTYDTWDLLVLDKAKGISNAGDPELEVARLPFDAGQILLRTAGRPTVVDKYAFKMVRNDATFSGGVASIIYNRGLVAGPRRPFGRNEDFDVEVYNLALVQSEIVVNPTTAGTVPAYTALPAITGTATVGQTLTLSNGTWTGSPTPTYTYQWFAGGVAIAGAVNNTFVLTSAQLGKLIQGRVVASNAAGTAQAFSNTTAAVT